MSDRGLAPMREKLRALAQKPAKQIHDLIDGDHWSCATCLDFGYRIFEDDCRSLYALAAYMSNIGGDKVGCTSCSFLTTREAA